jgi:hypothetical protein
MARKQKTAGKGVRRRPDMRPIEGIDRVKIILNPLFLAPQIKIKHIDPYNQLRLDKAGVFTTLQIQAEYFNPLLDYQAQIALAVYELVKKGVMMFPDTMLTQWFIYKNPCFFILKVTAVEFYSDFRYDNLAIKDFMAAANLKTAKDENVLFRYSVNGIPAGTWYSNDIQDGRKSVNIIYDKNEKDAKDNHIKKAVIDSNPNGKRFEWRLYCNNSEWLHWDNLRGSYKAVFNRYKEYLAVIYSNHMEGRIVTHGKENKNFNKVRKIAEKEQRVRYTGGKLKKTDDNLPGCSLKNAGDAAAREKAVTEFDRFSEKKINIRKAGEMKEFVQKSEEGRVKYV